MQTPADKLGTLLKKSRVSRADLGKSLGVSRNTVQNWLSGKYKMPDALVAWLDSALAKLEGSAKTPPQEIPRLAEAPLQGQSVPVRIGQTVQVPDSDLVDGRYNPDDTVPLHLLFPDSK